MLTNNAVPMKMVTPTARTTSCQGGPFTVAMDLFVEMIRRSRQKYINIPEFCAGINMN